jgi:hypothetical protein
MDRVAAALDRGERPLGATKVYTSSSAFERPNNGLVWIDVGRASKFLGGSASDDNKAAFVRLLFGPDERGIDVTAESEGGAETFLIGTGAAVAIAGVRRYLARAKIAEAQNAVSALARAAAAAYEREVLSAGGGKATTHRLCKSAPPVPATVPAGATYAAKDADRVDYNTGDDERGWRCLKFAMTTPQRYQYEYRQGGPYKGPKRGGPDPGPNGFEVSAEGDLDGNGKTSLFTRTGTIDPKTHAVRLSADLFVSDELE